MPDPTNGSRTLTHLKIYHLCAILVEEAYIKRINTALRTVTPLCLSIYIVLMNQTKQPLQTNNRSFPW